jgi:hypothetical protein
MAGQRDENIKNSSAAMNNSPEQQGDSWLEKRGFGGLDWASQKHYVVVVDPRGKVARRLRVGALLFRLEEIP